MTQFQLKHFELQVAQAPGPALNDSSSNTNFSSATSTPVTYTPIHINTPIPLMRFPTFPTLVRTFYTFTNATFRASSNPISRGIFQAPQRATINRSMPNIPFIGALFGSSTKMSDNSSFPVQKTEGEWQTELSPGTSATSRSRLSQPC
jgi:hypothetical protein